MWGEKDSNFRSRRQRIYSPPHLATLVSPQKNIPLKKGADGRIRTADPLITNQPLWPAELHRLLYFYTELNQYLKSYFFCSLVKGLQS